MVALMLEVQVASRERDLPAPAALRTWAAAALDGRRERAELVIRLVDEAESRRLNREYRHRDHPTNVLSFNVELPPAVESDLLGDLVICAPVVRREAVDQGKPLPAHWAHMVVHGVLHLLGRDHQAPREAQAMEAEEREILAGLGFADPYREEGGGAPGGGDD